MSEVERVLSNDGVTKETFHWDSDGKVHIAKTTDVTAIIDANTRQRNDAPERFESETMNHVARIDGVAIEMWCKARGVTIHEWYANNDLLRIFLNDPDNAAWRTRKGKI